MVKKVEGYEVRGLGVRGLGLKIKSFVLFCSFCNKKAESQLKRLGIQGLVVCS